MYSSRVKRIKSYEYKHNLRSNDTRIFLRDCFCPRLILNSFFFVCLQIVPSYENQIIYNNANTVSNPFGRAAEWYIVNHPLLKNAP